MSDSPTSGPEPTFVCDCDEQMRSACSGEPFYKEHEGKRYCVLHYPVKEKSADFKEALQRKLNNKDFNFRGVWFPDVLTLTGFDFSAGASFSSATFSADAHFSSAKFSEDADFSSATFSADAHFSSAKFSEDASFSFATFSARADFSEATFSARVSFRNATFSAVADFDRTSFSAACSFHGATFSAGSSFNSATFSWDADFGFASFHAASFIAVTFRGDADFRNATFNATVRFSNTFGAAAFFTNGTFNAAAFFTATFRATVSFQEATFRAVADFSRSTFSALADFRWATFEDYVNFAEGGMEPVFNDSSSLDLQFARIERPDHVSFHTLTLRPHWFVNVDARKFDLTNVHWDWRSISEEIQSLRMRLPSSRHRLLAIACWQLAVNAEENHRYEEASKFRYMAMDARRREKWRGFAFWRLRWWYWLASGFGEQMLQAFLVLLAILLLSALLYTHVGFARWEPKLVSESDFITAKRDVVGAPLKFTRALTYSLGVMTLQKPEPRPATTAAQTIVLLETILGPVQAALLALAIRRKFMR